MGIFDIFLPNNAIFSQKIAQNWQFSPKNRLSHTILQNAPKSTYTTPNPTLWDRRLPRAGTCGELNLYWFLGQWWRESIFFLSTIGLLQHRSVFSPSSTHCSTRGYISSHFQPDQPTKLK